MINPTLMNALIAALATFCGMFILVPVLFALCRALGGYTIVQERQCKVHALWQGGSDSG